MLVRLFLPAATLLLAMVLVAPFWTTANARPGLPETYIVGFHGPPSVHRGDYYQGERVKQVVEGLNFITVDVYDAERFIRAVRADATARYVEWDNPAYGVVDFVPNDSKYGDAGHWGSKKIGAEAAWDTTKGTTAVKVAVIDSGLRKTHEEFSGSGRVLQGHDFHNGDTNPNDDCGHGTHVTGTIAATINNAKGIAGMAQVNILPIKGLGNSIFGCTGSTSKLADALKYAGDQGAHLSSNSWGGGGASTTLNDAITYAHNKGTVHVAAAGNDGPCTNCVGQPWKANPTTVIIVACTTSADAQCSFSSEGTEVDVAAPGNSILSSWNGSDTSYNTISGTSMSTPHVTGTLALVKTLKPAWGYTDLDNCIKNTALDLGPAGKDNDFGNGRIRANQAVTCGAAATVPGAPTLSATAGNAQVSLSWTTPGDGGSALTGYKIYRGTVSGGETLLTSLGVTNSHTDTGLTNGQAYFYQVSAVNAVGEGARSAEVSATPVAPPVGPVLNENFDDGVANGWTLTGLWRVAGDCTANEPTTPNVLNYNQASPDCTYDTGAQSTGTATTSGLDINGITAPKLTFSTGYIKENYAGGEYDIMRVQVQKSGAAGWTTLWQRDSQDADQDAWGSVSLDLTNHKSTSTKIRFQFDSVDGFDNGYLGWVVDSVKVE